MSGQFSVTKPEKETADCLIRTQTRTGVLGLEIKRGITYCMASQHPASTASVFPVYGSLVRTSQRAILQLVFAVIAFARPPAFTKGVLFLELDSH